MNIKKDMYPFPHQLKFAKMFKNHNRLCLNLDLGLGKTITSLYWVYKYSKFQTNPIKLVIVAKKIKLLDWKETINRCKFIKSANIRIVNTKYNAKKYQQVVKNPHFDVVITTYGTLPRHFHKFRDHIGQDGTFIVDESQFLGNEKSLISVFMKTVSPILGNIIFLSGNPISNGYLSYKSQLQILGEHFKKGEFEKKYMIRELKTKGTVRYYKILGYKNVDKLLKLVSKYAKFAKTEDVIELPKQNFQTIRISNPTCFNFYQKLKKQKLYKDVMLDNPSKLYIAARQLTNSALRTYEEIFPNPKIEVVENLILSTSDSFVIFYNFNSELYTLRRLFKKLEIDCYEVNGHKNNYKELPKDNSKKQNVVLIQYKSGSDSIDLQQYTRTIYYSPTNSSGDYQQSLKRTHRVGQTKPVFYYLLQTNRSIEYYMYQALKRGEDYTLAQYAHDDLKFIKNNL